MNKLEELKNERKELLSRNWWLAACVILFGVLGFFSGIGNGDIASALLNFLFGILLGAFLPHFFRSFALSMKESFKAGVKKRSAEYALFFMVGMFFILIFKSVFWAIRDVFGLVKDFIVLTMEISKLEKEVQ